MRMFAMSVQSMVRVALSVVAMGALAGTAEAQQEGTYDWGRDNCQYVVQQGAWRLTDTCRVVRAAAVYDTYSRQTRRWAYRFDESDPRYTKMLSLTANPGIWIAFEKGGNRILYLQNGQWNDYAAAVRQQAAFQAQYNAMVARNQATPQYQAGLAALRSHMAAHNDTMVRIALSMGR